MAILVFKSGGVLDQFLLLDIQIGQSLPSFFIIWVEILSCIDKMPKENTFLPEWSQSWHHQLRKPERYPLRIPQRQSHTKVVLKVDVHELTIIAEQDIIRVTVTQSR